MQPYTGYYIWPPRTKSRIPYITGPVLNMWRKFPDAVAQFKINGNRNLVKVNPDRSIEFWNRRQERQLGSDNKTLYVIPDEMRAGILDISPAGCYTVWDTELVHTKTKNIKDVIYFFDCLVWESNHLLGMNYGDRFKIAQDRLGERFLPMNELDVKEHLYIAQNMTVEHWDAAWSASKTNNYVEGFVLKRTGNSSCLNVGFKDKGNEGWMCRIRKENKNYHF